MIVKHVIKYIYIQVYLVYFTILTGNSTQKLPKMPLRFATFKIFRGNNVPRHPLEKVLSLVYLWHVVKNKNDQIKIKKVKRCGFFVPIRYPMGFFPTSADIRSDIFWTHVLTFKVTAQLSNDANLIAKQNYCKCWTCCWVFAKAILIFEFRHCQETTHWRLV